MSACLTKQNKKTTVEWYRDSTLITSTKTTTISFNGIEMKLVITSTTEELSGTYKVVVTNESGKDESSALITIKVNYIIWFKGKFNYTNFIQITIDRYFDWSLFKVY